MWQRSLSPHSLNTPRRGTETWGPPGVAAYAGSARPQGRAGSCSPEHSAWGSRSTAGWTAAGDLPPAGHEVPGAGGAGARAMQPSVPSLSLLNADDACARLPDRGGRPRETTHVGDLTRQFSFHSALPWASLKQRARLCPLPGCPLFPPALTALEHSRTSLSSPKSRGREEDHHKVGLGLLAVP